VKDLGVVFSRVSKKGHDIEEHCKAAIKKEASYVFATEIAESTSYLRSVHEQRPVFDTRYAQQITRTNLDSLVRELDYRMTALVSQVPPGGHA
jgi:hypothetical protein